MDFSLAALHTVDIIKYWSLAVVPLAIVLFVLPCRLRVRHQALWIMFLLLCGAKGIVYEQFGGDALAPDLPEMLVWCWNWADDGMFFLTLLSLVWWVRPGRAFLLPALAWGLAGWGQFNGTVVPEVREIELAFPNLPPSLDGYRIVQISDLHCSSAARGWRTRAIVDRVNGLKADLVCLTGDYVDGKCETLADDLAPILRLRAKDGVYAVRGNHEYYADTAAWRNWFAEKGLRFLASECVFPRPGLALGGVNDVKAFDFRDTPPDVSKAFSSATHGEFRILLEHRPRLAVDRLTNCGVSLQLSGHTHGGVAPFVDRLVAKWNGGYVRGLYRIGKTRALYVSPGAGQWAGFPMRFFNPSEITLFTLRR